MKWVEVNEEENFIVKNLLKINDLHWWELEFLKTYSKMEKVPIEAKIKLIEINKKYNGDN